jgi:hypothetical protein
MNSTSTPSLVVPVLPRASAITAAARPVPSLTTSRSSLSMRAATAGSISWRVSSPTGSVIARGGQAWGLL